MAPEAKRKRKPAITMSRTDHDRLSRLAESFSATNATVADQLFTELDRARVVANDRVSDAIVRMGSSLRFTSDLGEDRRVTLVFPGEADISQGKVSILTPIGVALIGLSRGHSIDWTARDGRSHRLTVESVEAPAASPAGRASVELQPAP